MRLLSITSLFIIAAAAGGQAPFVDAQQRLQERQQQRQAAATQPAPITQADLEKLRAELLRLRAENASVRNELAKAKQEAAALREQAQVAKLHEVAAKSTGATDSPPDIAQAIKSHQVVKGMTGAQVRESLDPVPGMGLVSSSATGDGEEVWRYQRTTEIGGVVTLTVYLRGGKVINFNENRFADDPTSFKVR
jgi:hypothetical protein